MSSSCPRTARARLCSATAGPLSPWRSPSTWRWTSAGFRRKESVSLFPIVLAAFGALLYRFTGQADLLIGSPVANRSLPELEELIGLFLNMLVLRLDFSGDLSAGELLAQARRVVFDALEHQDMPYERLLRDLHLGHDPSRNPLFQVALALQNTPEMAASVPGLTIEPLPATAGSAKFDLQLIVHESGAQTSVSSSTPPTCSKRGDPGPGRQLRPAAGRHRPVPRGPREGAGDPQRRPAPGASGAGGHRRRRGALLPARGVLRGRPPGPPTPWLWSARRSS